MPQSLALSNLEVWLCLRTAVGHDSGYLTSYLALKTRQRKFLAVLCLKHIDSGEPYMLIYMNLFTPK